MDSSRRTLQRVSDDESSLIAVDQMEKDGKKPYVPRRLIIGKDEYVHDFILNVINSLLILQSMLENGDFLNSGLLHSFLSELAGTFELAMVTSLLEIPRSGPAFWQVRRFDGVCILLDHDWLESGSTVNFLRDLENVTKMMENVPTFMIHQRLLSAQNFSMVNVPVLTANLLTRSYQRGCQTVLTFCKVYAPIKTAHIGMYM
uniref:Uncharacterized protein At1g21580 isoform X4 n=1 Tax=Rhizophora mucronata TaxID=61149 RepID=A0A2P2JZR0_RHIMU